MTEIRAASAEELPGVASFLARTISADPAYVSHGEIQTGLSIDGKNWVDDLEAKFREDLADLDEDRTVHVAINDGRLAGALIAFWALKGRTSYVVIEDLAVDPACRRLGIGDKLVRHVEEKARDRKVIWSFLESGLNNHGAHDFFVEHGYAAISKVFARRLDPR